MNTSGKQYSRWIWIGLLLIAGGCGGGGSDDDNANEQNSETTLPTPSFPTETSADFLFTVNSTADSVDTLTADGQCKTIAGVCTLRAAIMEANALYARDQSAIVIELPTGIYSLTEMGGDENDSQQGDLDIHGNMTIAGGGSLDTVIDGTILSDRVMDVHASAILSLTGVSLKGGLTDNNGAGIQVGKASVYLEDVRIVDNKSRFASGGGMSTSGNIEGHQVYIARNQADDGGGGIQQTGATDAQLVLYDSIIESNEVNGLGGGLYARTGTVKLDKVILRHNLAHVHGGGLYGTGADFEVINSHIAENEADHVAGGIYNTSGLFVLRNSTISGNTARTHSGGGIHHRATASSYTFRIDNSTISGNTAAINGGGIWNIGSMGITFSTITENNATGSGGGIKSEATLSNTASDLRGVILVSNTAGETGDDCDGNVFSFGYNVFGTTQGCILIAQSGDTSGIDPQLSTLENRDSSLPVHYLSASSPVHGIVPSANCLDTQRAFLTEDQLGRPRPGSDDACDPGAIEADQ